MQAGRLLWARWAGRGGLFEEERGVTRLAPLECTLWLSLALFRLLGRALAPAALLAHARAGRAPFLRALAWLQRRLALPEPPLLDNGALLGLYRSAASGRRSALAEQSSAELLALRCAPAQLCARARALLQRCALRAPPLSAAALLAPANQLLGSALPACAARLAALAAPLLARLGEPALTAALALWLMRAASSSSSEDDDDDDEEDEEQQQDISSMVALARFAALRNRCAPVRPLTAERVPRAAADALRCFAQLRPPEQLSYEQALDELSPPPPPPPAPPLFFSLSPLLRRPARPHSARAMPSARTAACAAALSVLCGCETDRIWPALRLLDKTFAPHFE